MELREGAQPGDPAMQFEKYTPSDAILSNAGVFTKSHPAKLVCAKDWSSLMAKRMLGRLAESWACAELNDVETSRAINIARPVK